MLKVLGQQADIFFNWLDKKLSFLEPNPVRWDYRGIVHSYELLDCFEPDLEENNQPYYVVRFMDGEEFEINFPEVPAEELEKLLSRGQVLQLIYTLTGVEEIHPLKNIDFKVLTLRQVLDEADLDFDDTLLKVRYQSDNRQPITLEMIPCLN